MIREILESGYFLWHIWHKNRDKALIASKEQVYLQRKIRSYHYYGS
jgi:hypothetical protein